MRGQSGAREDVIQAPSHVALPHVPPRRPPREEIVVVGIQRAAEIHEAPADELVHQRALFRELADGQGLALFGVHIPIGQRDVHVPAEHEAPAGGLKRLCIRVHGFEKSKLGWEVLAAVRDVDGRDGDEPGVCRNLDGCDPVFEVELGMREGGTGG